jgi:hypothetical protein
MQNKMISFTDPQSDFMKEEARILGLNFSDLIRRIVDEYRIRIRESKEETRRSVMMAHVKLNESLEEN